MGVSDDAILLEADNLQNEAADLLGQAGLLACIQATYPCRVSGSVALGLMVRRDVDIWAELPDDHDIPGFFQVGARIVGSFQVAKASFSNHFIRGLPEFDHGLYWGVEINHRGQRWKLDLWGYGPERYSEHTNWFDELRRALAGVGRVNVLRAKKALLAGGHYDQGITGLEIYEAVLSGARSKEQVVESALQQRALNGSAKRAAA